MGKGGEPPSDPRPSFVQGLTVARPGRPSVVMKVVFNVHGKCEESEQSVGTVCVKDGGLDWTGLPPASASAVPNFPLPPFQSSLKD